MGTGEIITNNTVEEVEVIPSEGMVAIMPFNDFTRQFNFLNGSETVPDFALIPTTTEHGLSSKRLWNKVLAIAGDIVAVVPNLIIKEEHNITPPRISLYSEITDQLNAPEPEAQYLNTISRCIANNNLRPIITA